MNEKKKYCFLFSPSLVDWIFATKLQISLKQGPCSQQVQQNTFFHSCSTTITLFFLRQNDYVVQMLLWGIAPPMLCGKAHNSSTFVFLPSSLWFY